MINWLITFKVGGQICYDTVETEDSDPGRVLDGWWRDVHADKEHDFVVGGGLMRAKTGFISYAEITRHR